MSTFDYKTFLAMREKKKIIEKKYNDTIENKFFKITWMNWGLICGFRETVVHKIWIIDFDGNVGFYKTYTQNKVSDLIIKKMSNETFNTLKYILSSGFENEKNNRDGCDGVGYEMILYDDLGQEKHKFCGYIYHSDYLQKIAKLVENSIY